MFSTSIMKITMINLDAMMIPMISTSINMKTLVEVDTMMILTIMF